jgi:DNA polymerase III sliding clamp (beta) subunit (PCNA family)
MEEQPIVEFSVDKNHLKNAIKAQAKFALRGKRVEGIDLASIKFKIDGDILQLSSTDGERALQSELNIVENLGSQNHEFYLSAALCSKLVFIKTDLIDEITISIKEKGVVGFYDNGLNTLQTLAEKEVEHFPDIDSLFVMNTNKFTVAISPKLIKDITSLSTPKGYLEISLNSKSATAPIQVYSPSDDLRQRALICPVDLKAENS